MHSPMFLRRNPRGPETNDKRGFHAKIQSKLLQGGTIGDYKGSALGLIKECRLAHMKIELGFLRTSPISCCGEVLFTHHPSACENGY